MTTFSLFRSIAFGDGLVRPLRALRSGLALTWARWATADALSQLNDHELRDIGLSRHEIPGRAARAARETLFRLGGAF